MKIAYNPKTAAVITTATAANDDILFDLNAKKVWAKGLRMGADWADISSKPSSLKNPYALTISLNGTSQGPYDGSAAKNINITPGSIGAAVSNHSHDYLVVNTADDKSFNSAYHNFLVLYAGGGNGITGKPANVDAFGLFKFRVASGWSGQMLLSNKGNLYIRSSEDAKMTNTLAWKTILDSSNYSDILDSRYYTESEVNNLLSRKLDRVNLTIGSWNPRSYNLAADYHYNGGDLSISESEGKIHVSVDGYFWLNEGLYRVLDTSDVAELKSNLTVHLYLSNTDNTWYPLIWGGGDHTNTSDSTGTVYKSYDKLSWLTSSLTLYATHLKTTDLNTLTALFHPDHDSTLKIYSGKITDAKSDGNICLLTSIDGTDGLSHAYPTQFGYRCNLVLQPRGGQVYIGTNPDGGNTAYKLYVNGGVYASSRLDVRGDAKITGSIRDLAIGGGIYWDPHAESASDNSDAASITVVRAGVAGGTTLVLSLMNDANDTILFKTNGAARLYHNNNFILTSKDTKVTSGKGYIDNTEITQVNNSDKVDNRHAISTTPNTGIIYKAAIYTVSSLTSYWVRLASISSISLNEEFIATIHVLSGHSNPGRSAILLVYLRGGVSSFISKSFKICCNSNYDPNRFRLYYKDSDKTSEIWYQTTGLWDGIITTVISLSSEGSLYEGLTLYSGRITAVQTPSMSTYLSALVSTITDNISGNASTATKLQTARNIWGHSFNGTADVNGTIYINNNNSSEGAIRLNNNVNSNARISAIDSQVIFNTDAAIRFGGASWDWNVWAGLKYNHSNKTIYLGLADGSVFNANSALSGGSLRFPGISNVYATTFNGSLSGNASTATNADTVDGYHASGLWRSDGATWNPGASVSLNASANNQEWSFDIRRNGYTGCYWHVWDSTLNSMLKVNADNGKVYAPYNFVGNLEGNASSSSKWLTARTFTIGNTSKNVDGSGNVSWSLSEIGVRDTWRTVQVNGTSIGNNTLNLCGSTYIGLTNVNGKVTFSLVGSGTTANQAILSNGTANEWTLKTLNIANWDTAYNLRHSHANKSVLDGITSGLVTNWNTAYTFVSTITGEDADNVINKWDEIVNFLAGITEDNKLNTLLNSKLSILLLSSKDILTTKTNNALFWVNTIGTAGSITTGPFTDHPYALLSVTNFSQNDTNGKFFYRSRLAFSSAGDIKVASCHHVNEYKLDEAWYNVLTSKNSGIDGSTIKLNGTSITVYSSGTADSRYVKKSGDTMSGALNFANNIWNNVGDDVAIGDHNIAGCLGIKGLNAGPGLAFCNSSNTLLGKLVGTANLFLRVSGDNTYNILDNSTTHINDNTITINGTSLTVSKSDHNHDDRYVRAFDTSNDNIDSDWGLSFKTFDPIPSGTPPELNPNISLLSIGSFNRGKLLAFTWSNDNIYYRRHVDNSFTNWRKLAFVDLIPTSLKNPHSLTLKANGTTLATYDGSSAKEANFTYANVGAASANHNHDNKYLRLDGSNTMTGQIKSSYSAGTWINGCTNAILKATSDGYNSLICAPIKSGNICISAWTSEDNLNFGYAKNGKTENSFDTRMYWDAPNNNLHAAAFTGHLYGTADNATDADKLDGYHASGLLTALSNSDRGISLTVGGTTKSLSNISVGDADTVDGEHASAFTRIVGRHSIATDGTKPYRYIHLFRIANSGGYSTVDCEIDLRTRYHSAKLEIRIATNQYPYSSDGSSISIIKKVINGRSCNFWVLETVQSSGYNYYDIYYESGSWNTGVYDIISRGNNGVLVFEHKGTKLDALPDNVSVVNNLWVIWKDIAEKPSSFTPAAHNHDGRYLRLNGLDTMQGNLKLFSYGDSYIGKGSGDKSGEDFTEANIVIRSWWGISFKSYDDKVRTYIDTRTGNIGTKGKFIGNLTGNATSATKVIVNLHTANDINYPLVWSNLSNTSNATENQLHKSWLDLYYNPKNKRLFVKGSVNTANINATGTVTSAGFKHSGVTKNANLYVLTADGGYTFLNLTSNELAHEFDVDITVTSEWLDIEDFYGGNLNFLTLPGTYIVLVYYTTNSANSMYEGYFSGIMSWYTGTTNSNNADEIVLHRVGHAYANTIYLRTRESLRDDPHPYTKLQISANSDLKQHTYKFKFKRIC